MLFSGIIKKKFDAVLGRYDGEKAILYPRPSDFKDLKCESYNINGDKNITLVGCFYYYDKLDCNNLIVFDHGIGQGHYAYLYEIDYLARHGYTVYAYDHTGCNLTKGEGILGFAQGVNDLDHVLNVLNDDSRFKDQKRKLIGHSWGAYASMNVVALHPEVSHVVSLAGFISAKSLVEQYIPKAFLKYSKEVMERERAHNPKYTDMNAIDSLNKSKAKLLHLQSHDDIKVKFDLAYELLEAALNKREGTYFIDMDNHNHDPQRTVNAEKLNKAMLEDLNQLKKKHKLDTSEACDNFKSKYNWKQIYEQDEETWNHILKFLSE